MLRLMHHWSKAKIGYPNRFLSVAQVRPVSSGRTIASVRSKRGGYRQIAYPAKRKRVLDCMDALKARKIDQRTIPLIDSLIKFHIHKVPLLVSAYIFDDTLRGLYSVSKREIARHG